MALESIEPVRLLRGAWKNATSYLETVWDSSGHPEDPVPDVGGGAHWMSCNTPRAWAQVKAGGSSFRRFVAETEREVGAAVRLMAHKGIAALRVSRPWDPEIMAAVAVLTVYEPHLAAAAAGMGLAEPGIAALKKLARRAVLDAFSPA